MKRDDRFTFTVGYYGTVAVVDRESYKNWRHKSLKEMIKSGLYHFAFRRSLSSGNSQETDFFIEEYSRLVGTERKSLEQLKRIFGVYSQSNGVRRFHFV